MTKYPPALRLLLVATFAALACACGEPSTSAPATDAGAGAVADAAVREDVVILVRADEDARPLEGATVAIEQDGVISLEETDREGRASFVFDPDGSPVTVSASYRRRRALTRVAVEVDKLLEARSMGTDLHT